MGCCHEHGDSDKFAMIPADLAEQSSLAELVRELEEANGPSNPAEVERWSAIFRRQLPVVMPSALVDFEHTTFDSKHQPILIIDTDAPPS